MDMHDTDLRKGDIVCGESLSESNTFRIDHIDQQANKVLMVGRKVLTPEQEHQHAKNNDLCCYSSYSCGDEYVVVKRAGE